MTEAGDDDDEGDVKRHEVAVGPAVDEQLLVQLDGASLATALELARRGGLL